VNTYQVYSVKLKKRREKTCSLYYFLQF